MSASAFKGSYADWKLIKTRGVVQVVVEIPLADADAAYAVLGGMPDPGHERWVAVAALQSAAESAPRQIESKRTAGAQCISAAMGGEWCVGKCRDSKDCSATPLPKAKRDWNALQPQQQAGIRCGEPSFVAFLKEQRPNDWTECVDAAECVRLICGVESRAMIGINQKARVIWHQLDEQYQVWMKVPV